MIPHCNHPERLSLGLPFTWILWLQTCAMSIKSEADRLFVHQYFRPTKDHKHFALLALCEGNPTVTGYFSHNGSVGKIINTLHYWLFVKGIHRMTGYFSNNGSVGCRVRIRPSLMLCYDNHLPCSLDDFSVDLFNQRRQFGLYLCKVQAFCFVYRFKLLWQCRLTPETCDLCGGTYCLRCHGCRLNMTW